MRHEEICSLFSSEDAVDAISDFYYHAEQFPLFPRAYFSSSLPLECIVVASFGSDAASACLGKVSPRLALLQSDGDFTPRHARYLSDTCVIFMRSLHKLVASFRGHRSAGVELLSFHLVDPNLVRHLGWLMSLAVSRVDLRYFSGKCFRELSSAPNYVPVEFCSRFASACDVGCSGGRCR
jgi:hypothetical protein